MNVGMLEDLLRKFDKGTEIHVSCDNCNHGASGGDDLIKITDKTNQTYEYLELTIHHKHNAKVELAVDEKEFYEREIEKLKEQLEEYKHQNTQYRDKLDSIDHIIHRRFW